MAGRGAVSGSKQAFLRHLTQSPKLPHGSRHERFPRHLWHLPRDYELAIRWLRPSFLTRDHWTPGRNGRISMELRLYDTLTKEKRVFTPLDPKHVRMYVCGPTVYDFAHIGNARPVIVFDTLYRVLKRHYPKVTYVRNITDVEDKIRDKSKETGEPIDSITKRTT